MQVFKKQYWEADSVIGFTGTVGQVNVGLYFPREDLSVEPLTLFETHTVDQTERTDHASCLIVEP